MRVGIDGTPLLGPMSGIPLYTRELVSAFARLAPDDDFFVFPFSWRLAGTMELPPAANLHAVRKVAPGRVLRELWDRVPFPPLEWYVDCEVFHGTNFIAPPTRRAKTVITVHDLSFLRHPELVGPRERELTRLLPKMLRRCSAVITDSEFTRGELLDWQPHLAERTVSVLLGGHARPPASSTGLPEGPPYALVLGSLNPRKNLGVALEATRVLRQRGVEIRLVFAGSVHPTLDVDALLAAHPLPEGAAVVTGYADDARVAALLRDASLLVLPSRYEGFGMPLVEAMDAGVPIVAAAAGSVPEVVDHAALLVDPDDVDGFAGAMEQVLSDAALRSRLIAAGHVRARRFSWETTALETLSVYRRAAAV